jgi:hypothetical protein
MPVYVYMIVRRLPGYAAAVDMVPFFIIGGGGDITLGSLSATAAELHRRSAA